jgi:hypothetical protein
MRTHGRGGTFKLEVDVGVQHLERGRHCELLSRAGKTDDGEIGRPVNCASGNPSPRLSRSPTDRGRPPRSR